MIELYPVNPRIQKQIDLFKKSRKPSRFPMLFLDIPAYRPENFKQPFKPVGLERQMLNTLNEKYGVPLPRTVLEAAIYVEVVKSINRAGTYFTKSKSNPSQAALEYLKERGLQEDAYLAFTAGELKAIAPFFQEGNPTYEAHRYWVLRRAQDVNLEGLAEHGVDAFTSCK